MTELHIYPGDNVYIVYHFANRTEKRLSMITERDELTIIDDARNSGYGADVAHIRTMEVDP